MKKRILAIVAVVALMGLLLPATVFAGPEEAPVTCTVSAVLVSVTVTDGSVAYGTLALGATKNTIELTDTQTATNNGTVTEDFTIKSSDAGGSVANWDLVTTTPGNNEFKHEFSTNSGSSWTAMPADNSYTSLATSIAKDGTRTFDLKITMPGTTGDYQQHTITVTVLATQHS